jgi:hypothetical protein
VHGHVEQSSGLSLRVAGWLAERGLELLAGGLEALPAPEKEIRLGPGVFGRGSSSRSMRTLNGQAEVAWFYRQIIEMSEGREPNPRFGTWSSLFGHLAGEFRRARRRTFVGG